MANIHGLLETSAENGEEDIKKGFNILYSRLFINAVILESVFALSFGLPRIFSSVELDPNIIGLLFQKDKQIVPTTSLNHFKVGLILCKITSFINFNNEDYSRLKTFDIDSYDLYETKSEAESSKKKKSGKSNDLASNFLSLVKQRLELVEFLRQSRLIDVVKGGNDNDPEATIKVIEEYQSQLSQLCAKLLFKIIDLLSIICDESSEFDSAEFGSNANGPNSGGSISNGSSTNNNNSNSNSNSNNNNNNNNSHNNRDKNNKKVIIQSPFLPLIFKQSLILANLIKIIVNSMGFNKELLSFTSKILMDIMLINNYLPLIRPFNDSNNYGITHNDTINNNYNKFEFKSTHLLTFLEVIKLGGYIEYKFNSSSPQVVDKNFIEQFALWRELILDVEKYLRNEDNEGWLLR